MLKAVGVNDKGDVGTVIIGLSRENTELLLAGEPIMFRMQEIHPKAPNIAVVVIGNETEADLIEDFRVLGPVAEQ